MHLKHLNLKRNLQGHQGLYLTMVPLGLWEAHTNHLQQQQQQHTLAVVIKTMEDITLTQGPCSVLEVAVVTKCPVP